MADTMRVGEELGSGQSLQNGPYSLTMQPDGNLVLSENGNAVWASKTDGSGADKVSLQPDGNLVVYAGGDAKWASKTNGSSVDRLTLQPDRNVVLYGTDNVVLWSTGTHVESEQIAGEAQAAAGRTHTVEPGDTLWVIAERYYGDGTRFRDIAAASGIDNPDVIMPGQVLTIP